MSFFGLFGSNDPEANCECHKNLKEHLKKCAGYGDRPKLLEKGQCPPVKPECKVEEKDDCGRDKAEERVYLKPFVPVVTIPPTATFKCPPGTCVQECEKPKDKENSNTPPPPPDSKEGCCGGSSNSGSGSKGNKNSSGSDNDNSCEPRPLKW